MSYETMNLNSQLTDVKPQQMHVFRAIVYNYQLQSPVNSNTLNVEPVDIVSKSSFSSPEICEAIEETLHEGAEIWKELAKY